MSDVLDTLPCGVLCITSDGTIQRANSTLAQWLSTSPEDVQGRSVKTLLSMGGRVFYETHFWPQLKLQGHIEEIYFLLRTPSGETVPVLANAVRRECDGEALYDCIFMRVRRRDQYENELILAKKAAQQANLAKDSFLSMMSHELRTPLNAIGGFTELLVSGADGPTNQEQQEDLRCIQNATDDLLRLIDDILNFAHMEKEGAGIKWKLIDVGAAVERASALLKPRFQEAGLEFHLKKALDTVKIQADPGRLQQILLNLLNNAIKFTPRGGRVDLSFSLFDDWVLLEVHDSGCGIAEEHLERIFEPFVQVDRLQVASGRRGVGLGLAICRNLARAMNGDLSVSSTLGHGSTFTLSLPQRDALQSI